MPFDPNGRTPCWQTPPRLARVRPLDTSRTADVCVVGAGIAGLSVATMLARAGLSVVVLEAAEVGAGETGRTTAHLSSALDDRFHLLESSIGQDSTALAAQSHAAAIDTIEHLAGDESIDCDFTRVDGYLVVPPALRDRAERLLDQELHAAHRAGVTGAELVTPPRLPAESAGKAIRFPRQGRFHPLRYLAGLLDAIERRNAQVFTHTRATAIEGGPGARVETDRGHTISAGAIVVATNTPVNDRVRIHAKQAPYRTFAVALRCPRGTVPDVLTWDGYWTSSDTQYHYIRLQPDGDTDILIVGGEDHRTGHADDGPARLDALEAWTRARVPAVGPLVAAWSGQVIEPHDGIAYIGRNPHDHDNVYVCTGDSGMGMTHATIAGILLTDLILGRANPWSGLYDPARITLAETPALLSDAAAAAAPYTDWIRSGEVSDAAEIPVGSGAIVRRGIRRIAVYHAPGGTRTELSATCPHLGCSVRWNSTEKSWDCPCHGSRFGVDGSVRNGPANAPLVPESAPHETAPDRPGMTPAEGGVKDD